ncbi:hypothetical protein [Streptomyces sp. NBC_01294]|uniref:hypothetical protein n=1 Tax=Streptomyces sp. NBC_01294 TaxID=2903815 RepID=UPI003FA38B91
MTQVDALAEAIGIRWRLRGFLGAHGPMRPEEQAELQRKDVDLDAMTIRVRKAVPEMNTGKRAPKARPSRRVSGSEKAAKQAGEEFQGQIGGGNSQ